MACRPEQYAGPWAIVPARFSALVGMANDAITSGYLVRGELRDAPAGMKPYTLSSDGVATLDVSGPLTKYDNSFQALFGGTSTVRTRNALRDAVRDTTVRAIVLRVDSPGGTFAGTGDLAEEVRRADAQKPVYAFLEDLTASAALWVAVQARRVYSNANALVGSIGVFSTLVDSSEAATKAGHKVRVISTAPLKGAKGVAGAPVSDEAIADEQRLVSGLGDLFVEAVATGRRMPPARARALATGELWIATDAVRLGLVDGVSTLEETAAAALTGSRSTTAARAEATSSRTAPPAPPARQEDDVPRKKYEVLAQLEAEARAAHPAESPQRAQGLFLRTPRGAQLYAEYCAAPGANKAPAPAAPEAGADPAFVALQGRAQARFPKAPTREQALALYARTPEGAADCEAYRAGGAA